MKILILNGSPRKGNVEALEELREEGKNPDMKLCVRCGQPMKKRNGKFGKFWGCSGSPQCRHTENI